MNPEYIYPLKGFYKILKVEADPNTNKNHQESLLIQKTVEQWNTIKN